MKTTTAPVNAPTMGALLDRMLTKAQIATAQALSDLDMDGLRLVSSNGKGASRRLALEFVALADLDKAFNSFALSGCKQVRTLATLVKSITGKFTESSSDKGLSACPTSRADFLEYGIEVAQWARSSTNEKTNASRAKLSAIVSAIIARAQSMVNAHYAEQAAMQAEQAAMQAGQAAMQAEQAAMQAEQAAMQATVKAYNLDNTIT